MQGKDNKTPPSLGQYHSSCLYFFWPVYLDNISQCTVEGLFPDFPFCTAKMIYFTEKENDLQVNRKYINIENFCSLRCFTQSIISLIREGDLMRVIKY